MLREHTIYEKGNSNEVATELWEQTEYMVDFGEGWTQQDGRQVLEDYKMILEPLHGSLYRMNYQNFVGVTRFCGLTYEVRSRKLSNEDVEQMHRLISSRLATLPYHRHTPTQTSWVEDVHSEPYRLYQWYGTRIALLEDWEGAPLRDWWQRINRDPHHVLVSRTVRRPVGMTATVGAETVMGILAHPEHWVQLPEHHAMRHTAAAQALTVQGRHYVPSEVYDQESYLSYDTSENRLMKLIAQELLALTEWMAQRLRARQHLYNRTELELHNRQMAQCLEELLASSWLAEVGDLRAFPQASTVLQRKAGYRQWYSFYQYWLLGGSFPLAEEELRMLVDTKELSRIYEYWCYFSVIDLVQELTGRSPSTVESQRGIDRGERLVNGLCVTFDYPEGDIQVYYNHCFAGGKGSYSMTYKPDISLSIQGRWHHFDAKLKVDTDDYGRQSVKKEDLDKMHTYRDAILDTESVWVLYPAECGTTQFHRDRRSASELAGVGAVPLKPGHTEQLRSVMGEVIGRSGTLYELLSRITSDNVHAKLPTGEPQGNEVTSSRWTDENE